VYVASTSEDSPFDSGVRKEHVLPGSETGMTPSTRLVDPIVDFERIYSLDSQGLPGTHLDGRNDATGCEEFGSVEILFFKYILA
jgi:hypothetical protein